MNLAKLEFLLTKKRSIFRAVFVLYMLYKFVAHLRESHKRKALLQKAKEVLGRRNAKEYNFIQISPEKESLILSSSVTELSALMRKGELTSFEIVTVYSKRASTIGRELSLTTEENFEESLKDALKCDQLMKSAIETQDFSKIGLLHGIPVSIKDLIKQKGFATTLGFISRADIIEQDDAILMQVIRAHGAIPFVRSNIPQSSLAIDSDNRLWGRSKNPWNKERSCGGSSGGEGGLVASRCSPLGVGTDIGGSLRIPAHFCGVTSLKPTPHRMPTEGFAAATLTGVSGQSVIEPAAGPIAKTVDDCALFFKVMWSDACWKIKPEVPKLYFDNEAYTSRGPLRIGYCESVEYFEACPSIQQAIKDSVKILKSKGHEMVPYKIENLQKLAECYARVSAPAFDAIFKYAEEKEGLMYFYKKMHFFYSNSKLRRVIMYLLKFIGEKRLFNNIKNAKKDSAAEFFEALALRKLLFKEFVMKWKEEKMDAFLCPVLSTPAFYGHQCDKLLATIAHCTPSNLFGLPAGSVPVRLSIKEEETYTDVHNDMLTKELRRAVAGSAGLPIGVQVVGLPYSDEKVLRVMKEIEEGANFYKFAL